MQREAFHGATVFYPKDGAIVEINLCRKAETVLFVCSKCVLNDDESKPF